MKKLRTQVLFFNLLFIAYLTFLFGCALWRNSKPQFQASHQTQSTPWAHPARKKTGQISLVTANVENLFDTQHDPNKLDYEFLPKSLKKSDEQIMDYCLTLQGPAKSKCRNFDWSQQALEEKIRRLRRSLTQKDPLGPDILLLQEVENQRVLNQLAQMGFPESGYQTRVILEGQDPRGIDPALLSHFPLAGKPQLHPLHLIDPNQQDQEPLKTRGLLQVPLQTPWGNLQVFVLHLPSQYHSSQVRKQALQQLMDLIKKQDPQQMFVVGGDFNISAEEERNLQFYEKTLSQNFLVSHLWSPTSAAGTTQFKGVWSFFDVFLFSKHGESEKHPCRPLAGSVDVLQALPLQKTKEGYPKHFRPKSHFGVSDHFPVRAILDCRSMGRDAIEETASNR
jgi:endonuclease/exonuclease/phosphatase family metal-dependent hydrolase